MSETKLLVGYIPMRNTYLKHDRAEGPSVNHKSANTFCNGIPLFYDSKIMPLNPLNLKVSLKTTFLPWNCKCVDTDANV